MDPTLATLRTLVALLWARLGAVRSERGMTTETVIITSLLAILALTAGGIIAAKVLGKANSISVD